MDTFMKACALALLTVVLGFTVNKGWREAGLLLSLCALCMVTLAAIGYLSPVIDLLRSLQRETGLDGDLMAALLKIVGIGLTAEIAGLVCTDAGNAGLGKTIALLGTAVILWLSVPLLTQLLDLTQQILGGI